VAAVVEERLDTEASGEDRSERPAEGKTQAEKNRENVRSVGAIHGTAVVAALALFGAAHTWAAVSGWPLATATAVAAAVIGGVVLSSISHEWGHFSGAVLSRSRYKVARKPFNYFFMFNFDMAANSARQAIWMSWGGLAGSWLLLVVLAIGVPLDSLASAALVATVLGQAVNASVFEVPIVLRTRETGDFEQALYDRLDTPGVVKTPGLVVGLLAFALLT